MKPLDYFKLQAKNLFKDYKTKKPVFDEIIKKYLYEYTPKYFDVDGIVCDWDLDEDNFTLMKAQHVIAQMVGFDKWAELINASEVELELAKLLFDNQDKVYLEDWLMYLDSVEDQIGLLDDESKLDLFKEVHLKQESEFHNPWPDYRLHKKNEKIDGLAERKQLEQPVHDIQITSLPLSQADHAEFVATANEVFETILERIEPNNPVETRKLWDAEDYIDNHLLTNDMLPISRGYALSLIDAILVHHVIGLAVQADKGASVA